MSLINDALKRAQAAQEKEKSAAPPPGQFRPVEPNQQEPQRPLWPFFIFAAAVVVAGLVMVNQFSKEPLKVQANTPAHPIEVPKPVTPQPTRETATTNATVPVEPPKPVVPKLQGIVFNRTRPSAIINGKAVLVGDKVGEFRIDAITRDTVTIVSATQTNILGFAK